MITRRTEAHGPTPVGQIIPRVLAGLRPPTPAPTTASARAARYLAATRFALTRIVPIYRAANIPITDVGIATIVGQLLALAPSTPTGAPSNGTPNR